MTQLPSVLNLLRLILLLPNLAAAAWFYDPFSSYGLLGAQDEPASSSHSASSKKQFLQVTALANDAANQSVLQCWEFVKPFDQSNTPGTVGALVSTVANVSSVVYTVVPAHLNGGLHRAPKAHSAYSEIRGGPEGLLVAADTAGDGHFTNYPSDQETVALQLPFKDGVIPAYKVLHATKPCPRGSQVVAAGGSA